MNQGQIVGPAMLMNIIMRWPRAAPIVAMCAYGATAYAGEVNTVVSTVIEVIAAVS